MGFKWIKESDLLRPPHRLSQYYNKNKVIINKKGKKDQESDEELCNRIFSQISFTFTEKKLNALVVADDASNYISSQQPNKIISKFVNLRGQNNCDFIAVFHGLRDIPRYLIQKADFEVILFPSPAIDESDDIAKANILLSNAQMIVNFLLRNGIRHVFARVNNETKKVTYEKINMNENGEINPNEKIIIFNKKSILDAYFKQKNIPLNKRNNY